MFGHVGAAHGHLSNRAAAELALPTVIGHAVDAIRPAAEGKNISLQLACDPEAREITCRACGMRSPSMTSTNRPSTSDRIRTDPKNPQRLILTPDQ